MVSFRPGSEPCCVYVIARMDGQIPAMPVKVGISSQPGSRLGGIATSSPFPVKILHCYWIPSRAKALQIEADFHAVHAENRAFGEWFNVDPAVATEGVEGAIDIDMHFSGMCHCVQESLWEKIGRFRA